jgi:hypothetical protein
MNNGKDNPNVIHANTLCESEDLRAFIAMAIASEGVHDKKKKTNDKKTVKIIAVFCSLIIPPIPLESAEPIMLPRSTPNTAAIIVG